MPNILTKIDAQGNCSMFSEFAVFDSSPMIRSVAAHQKYPPTA